MQDLRFDELEFQTAQDALTWMDADIQAELEGLEIDYSNCGFIFKYLEDQTRLNEGGYPYLESIKLNLHSIVALLMQWEPELRRWAKLMEILTINEDVKRKLETYVFGFSSIDTYSNDFFLDLYCIDQFQIPIHQARLEGEENLLHLLGFLYEDDYESSNWELDAMIGDRTDKGDYANFLDWFFNKAVNRYYEILSEKINHSWEEYLERRNQILSFSHCYALAESHIYRVDEDGEIIDFFPINELKIESIA